MKYLLVILIALIISVSSGMDGSTSSTVRQHSGPTATDDWVLTVLNTFAPSFTTNIRGLDFNEPNTIYFISGAEYNIFACSADDGSYQTEYSLDSSNESPYGIADSGNYANVNDFGDTVVYYFDGSNWYNYVNPASSDGRGMDYDGSYIWENYTSSGTFGVYGFDDGGTLHHSFILSEIPTQLSGLAVFDPGTGNTGIAVTTYNTHNIWLYDFDGSSMNYLGMVALPGGANSSLGLCYSTTRGTFFWSYTLGGTYTISELEITESALDHSTWGNIKTCF